MDLADGNVWRIYDAFGK